MKKITPSNAASSQVFIVEASAGSGKTYTLAKRYVSLILDPSLKTEEIPLSSVLAITFTNKAAFEMKERILDLLKKIALDKFVTPEEKADVLQAIGQDEAPARKKAFAALDQIIRNYNFFQVQTIDSFINALLSGCAFKLDLSAGFRIKSDHSQYLAYSLDRLIDRAGQEKGTRRLFDEFLRQYLYLENRSGWFAKAEMIKVMETLLSRANTYGGDFNRFNGSIAGLMALKKNLFKDIRKLSAQLPEGTDKRLQAKVEKLLESGKNSVDIGDVSTFFDREGFPARKGSRVGDEVTGLWENIRLKIRELCETEAFVYFNCYVEMFELFFQEFKNAAIKDDVVFLSELNRQARALFDNQFVTVPELYFRLSSRFKNYLIDEFQDTSYLQWKNIFPLVEDGLSSSGTLFYVGDKKQAIYRFRGGEVLLFDQVKEELKAFGQQHSVLSKNYRSREEVVRFNNELFSTGNLSRAVYAINEKKSASALSLEPEDIAEIVGFFKDSRQTNRADKPGGFVKVISLGCGREEDGCSPVRDALLAELKGIAGRFDYRDIAILARSNDDVELFASWLIEAGIPVESDKTLNIREHSLIKELVSLLKFLSSPIDNLSFASFILGDIFLQASGMKKEQVRDFLFRLGNNRRKEKNYYYYRRFREEFPQAWSGLFEGFFKNVGFVPLYELTVSVISRFAILGNFPQYQGFFMRLLELISEQEEEYPTIGDFLKFFDGAKDEDLYVDIPASNSVRVLTIHKSKGLEFRVVIMADLTLDIDINPNIVYSQDGNLNILRLKKEYVKFSPSLENIYRREYVNAFIDELNGIYVGFTRARDELYVFIPQKGSNKVNYAQMLFTEPGYASGKKTEAGQQAGVGSSAAGINFVEPGLYRDWIPLLKEEYVDLAELKNRDKIVLGDALHLIFSFIYNLKGGDPEKAISSAVEKAGSALFLPADRSKIVKQVAKLVTGEDWKRFFFLDGAKILNEQEIVNAQGQTKRIDRMIVSDLNVAVIDYKSSAEFGAESKAQMLEYLGLVREIYPRRTVKGYLLYFDGGKIEEIDG